MTLLIESTRAERIAYLTRRFILSGAMSTAEAAEATGVSQRMIQYDFAQMSRAIPIYQDNGRWVYVDEERPVEISPY